LKIQTNRLTKIAVATFITLIFFSCSSPLKRVEGQTFNSNGIRIHYTDEGEGTPVILLHGLAVNADLNWRRNGIIPHLSKYFRVIALDLRGHGLSGKPHSEEKYGLEMVEDVTRLMDHLGIEKVQLAGYSLGGKIALKFAAIHPERLLSLAVLGFGHGAIADIEDIESIAQDLEAGKGMPPIVDKLNGDDSKKPSFRHKMTIRMATRFLTDGKALAGLLRGIKEIAISDDDLEKMRLPVLTVVGEVDPIMPYTESMCNQIVDCKMTIIEGKDHINTVSEKQLGDELLQFLQLNEGE